MLNTASDLRQTLDHFRRSFDQFFDSYYGTPSQSSGNAGETTFSPSLESGWSDSHLHLRAILPAVDQNALKVTLNNNQLVIEGERKRPETWTRDGWTQLAYGRFQTAVTLPNGLDVDNMACRLHDGVLDISIPVSESRRPRQIQIQTGTESQQKTLGAKAQ